MRWCLATGSRQCQARQAEESQLSSPAAADTTHDEIMGAYVLTFSMHLQPQYVHNMLDIDMQIYCRYLKMKFNIKQMSNFDHPLKLIKQMQNVARTRLF